LLSHIHFSKNPADLTGLRLCSRCAPPAKETLPADMTIRSFSTEHTRNTTAPQTYWQHGAVAISKLAHLVWLGLAGVVHGFLPEIKGLQFYTSTGILRAAHYLMMCGRH
jgi:hypothetical protein